MPYFNILKSSEIENTYRVETIKGIFDLKIEKKIEEKFEGEIPIENFSWNIGIIVGKSGTGKSTIAKTLFKDYYISSFEYKAKSVIDDMPSQKSIKEIIQVFNAVGFSSIPSWLKPYSVLSQGEKMRVDIARAILEERELIVFDEFTSTVDREVAKILCIALSKSIRKLNKKFIAVSCHYDIIKYLEPDWIFSTDNMKFIKKKFQDLNLHYISILFQENIGIFLGNIII